MPLGMLKPVLFATSLAVLPVLAGCTESRPNIASDFGVSVKQDVAAQVADPDARYKGVPAPGSDGARVGLAQKRYQEDKVIEPTTLSASSGTIGSSQSSGGSSSSNSTSP